KGAGTSKAHGGGAALQGHRNAWERHTTLQAKSDLFLRADRPASAGGKEVQESSRRIPVVKENANSMSRRRTPPLLFHQELQGDHEKVPRCTDLQLQPVPRHNPG